MSDAASCACEHFVTLFNHKFLAMGLALHASLQQHAQPMHLWVICMDELVEQQLRKLALEHLSIIPLREVEASSPALLSVKPDRSAGEYCWTLTPFAAQAVMEREPAASRVTYVDADLYFFDDPAKLLSELDDAGKDVLITEHHYDPSHDQTATAGRFCVQFITFRNNASARNVMTWWQDRCIEWCFARHEDGKFGDQKYLDAWPEKFGQAVHVLIHNERILAPWNARWQTGDPAWQGPPVFYHFHGWRPLSETCVRAYTSYRIGSSAQRYYDDYMRAMHAQMIRMRQHGMPWPVFETPGGLKNMLGYWYSRLTGRGWYRFFPEKTR